MDPPKTLLDRISVRASSGSDYTFGNPGDRPEDDASCALGEASRQGQPPAVRIDGHDPHGKHIGDAHRPAGCAACSPGSSLTSISPSTPSARRANAPYRITPVTVAWT